MTVDQLIDALNEAKENGLYGNSEVLLLDDGHRYDDDPKYLYEMVPCGPDEYERKRVSLSRYRALKESGSSVDSEFALEYAVPVCKVVKCGFSSVHNADFKPQDVFVLKNSGNWRP